METGNSYTAVAVGGSMAVMEVPTFMEHPDVNKLTSISVNFVCLDFEMQCFQI